MQECLEFLDTKEEEQEEQEEGENSIKILEARLEANKGNGLKTLLKEMGKSILKETPTTPQARLVDLCDFLEAYKGKAHEEERKTRQEELLQDTKALSLFEDLLDKNKKSFNQSKLKAKCLELALQALEATELGAKLVVYYQLSQAQEPLKQKLKALQDELVALVLDKLKNLSEAEILELLGQKWFEPLENALFALPGQFVACIARKVQALVDKYAFCLQGVQKDIDNATKELESALEDLEGFKEHEGLQELLKILKA
ncbi:hypothetical protein NHP21005_09410 [Helicobacter sp. NHP21005]|uniref:type I restriction endonuclease subunit M n=1 Tax=Helicobacter felistomachi TaxID=3040201 RepID=UPI00257376EB|nr:type I restriction endonuclease subunit M [Helicobacter sp. NHP21005]BEG57253.1 hypothetical protein NHP21005_09410 [Helicobacter sp. NHP21005]